MPMDYRFSYSFYIRCCGLLAQSQQLARRSFRNSEILRAFFLGRKAWKCSRNPGPRTLPSARAPEQSP